MGGGITGCCIARDAARRGLTVALVERNDFSCGTSAATSKMVHGGLRYLQSLDVGVVRESLRERRAWQHVAPHLVQPLTFLLPTRTRREDWTYRLALSVYDGLSWDRDRLPASARHLRPTSHVAARDLIDLEPVLDQPLRGGLRYDDCHAFAPERAALGCVMDAVAHGACVANHVEVVGLTGDAPQQLQVLDRLTHTRLTIRARHIVNATGPWSDLIADRLGVAAPRRLVRSKGIHLVTRAITGRHALTVPVGGRHFFVIPWRDHSLIGTTDVPYDGSPDDVGVSETDIDDFLGTINRGLPAARLTRADVRWAYAGLRPLIAPRRGGTYRASRRADIVRERPGLHSAIGGKWTTSRALAEGCVDAVIGSLGIAARPCDTATAPLPGASLDDGPLVPDALDRRAADETRRLLGSHAERVFALARGTPALGAVIAARTFAAAIVVAVRDEMACTLGDIVFRRTGLSTLAPLPRATLSHVARLAQSELGWSDARCSAEVADVEAAYARVSMAPS
ncbi:MAG: glycerol-3-phosphate dehydrogenase/oxidase [Gemmatimonadaceae bacterium]|nr:glycerol-3-phosphate dehydrogenase/oxidase [Gemmatimonadaceae bacterium]